MLRWTLFFLALTVVTGISQFAQFNGDPFRAAEASLLQSLAFLIPFIAFLSFGLLGLGSADLAHDKHPFMDRLRLISGWR
jgi:hypothetical protein